MNDPYKILKIRRNADGETIEKAYKREARENHPDRGGDADRFRLVKLAYDILIDPERRQKFDNTGDFSEKKVDDTLVAAMQQVTNVFANIVQQAMDRGFDVAQIDFTTSFRDSFDMTMKIAMENKAKSEKMKRSLERCRGRFKRKKEGENLLEDMVEYQIKQVEGQIAKFDREIDSLQKAKKLAAEFDYKMEFVRQVAAGMAATSAAGGFGWYASGS